VPKSIPVARQARPKPADVCEYDARPRGCPASSVASAASSPARRRCMQQLICFPPCAAMSKSARAVFFRPRPARPGVFDKLIFVAFQNPAKPIASLYSRPSIRSRACAHAASVIRPAGKRQRALARDVRRIDSESAAEPHRSPPKPESRPPRDNRGPPIAVRDRDLQGSSSGAVLASFRRGRAAC
jgi:hypothetical protein